MRHLTSTLLVLRVFAAVHGAAGERDNARADGYGASANFGLTADATGGSVCKANLFRWR